MNYQNNMDAYSAYVQENRRIEKKEEKSKWLRIWFALSVFMLLLIWLYLSSLTPVETVKMEDPKKKLLEEASISKNILGEKSLIEPLSSNNKSTPSTTKEGLLVEKSSIKSLPTVTASIPAFVKKEKVDTKSELLEKTTKEVLLVEKSPIEPLSTIAASIPAIKSESLEKTKKLVVKVVKEELPVDLYHIYIVRKGESIYDIAAKQYGDTGMYLKIVNANKDLVNPNKIHEGEELFLPIVDESKSYSEILNFR